MTVTKTVENNRAVLLVEGWLDTKSSPELGKEINRNSRKLIPTTSLIN